MSTSPPMQTIPFISADHIRTQVTFPTLIDHLRQCHTRPCPDYEKALLTNTNSDGETNSFLIWPAWDAGQSLGAKMATIFPGNSLHQPLIAAVQAVYVLFEGKTGAPVALIDGTEMTYWKTAANSALACDCLARARVSDLLMVGAGDLAPYLVRAHLSVRPDISRIHIWNRTLQKARDLKKDLRTIDSSMEVIVVNDLAAAAANAQIICCATAATHPLILGEWLAPGTHLDLVGGFRPDMREVDAKAIARARMFVEHTKFTPHYAGEIVQAIAEGAIEKEHLLGDLFDLICKRASGRLSDDDITVFKTCGGGHLDLMTAQYLHKRFHHMSSS